MRRINLTNTNTIKHCLSSRSLDRPMTWQQEVAYLNPGFIGGLP